MAGDLGEPVLLAAVFEDGTALLYAGRLIKAVRRSWPKVRAKVTPPSREKPRMSRRSREIAPQERRQVEHLLPIVTAPFVREYIRRGVQKIAIGALTGIHREIADGARMTQRLRAWPYRQILALIRSKAALAGMVVRDGVDERGPPVLAMGVDKTERRTGSIAASIGAPAGGSGGRERCAEHLGARLPGISRQGA
jgi:IS605 OrfB family transposase